MYVKPMFTMNLVREKKKGNDKYYKDLLTGKEYRDAQIFNSDKPPTYEELENFCLIKNSIVYINIFSKINNIINYKR